MTAISELIERLTKSELAILAALSKYGPQFNGSLASLTNLAWNSRKFRQMERAGLITGHPFEITELGRRSLAALRARQAGGGDE